MDDDNITLSEVAKLLGVPYHGIRKYFELGQIFELVPRPQDPMAVWPLRRKDIEDALVRYEKLQEEIVAQWDNHFLHDAVTLD